jgi:hypothetical protein
LITQRSDFSGRAARVGGFIPPPGAMRNPEGVSHYRVMIFV